MELFGWDVLLLTTFNGIPQGAVLAPIALCWHDMIKTRLVKEAVSSYCWGKQKCILAEWTSKRSIIHHNGEPRSPKVLMFVCWSPKNVDR